MATREELRAAAERVLNQLDGHGPTTSTGDLRLIAQAVIDSEQRSGRACRECHGGSDAYYNTPGQLRDAPCPRCGGSGEEPATPIFAAEKHEPVNGWLLDACEMASKLLHSQWLCVGTVEQTDVRLALEDAIVAACAQAEDDAIPVEEEWLVTLGFRRDAADQNCRCYLSMLPGQPEEQAFGLLPIGDYWVAEMKLSGQPWSQGVGFGEYRNRGDVRKLLAALGVSPKSEFSRYAAGATGTA